MRTWRAAFLLCTVLGQGCGAGNDAPSQDGSPPPQADAMPCELEDVIAGVVGDETVTDCGTFPTNSELADLQAAHDCVVAAQDATEPYVVIFSPQGIDSLIRYAYLGLPGDAGLDEYYFYYDSDPSGGGMIGAVAGGVTCGAITEVAPQQCSTAWEYEASLCFECENSGASIARCN